MKEYTDDDNVVIRELNLKEWQLHSAFKGWVDFEKSWDFSDSEPRIYFTVNNEDRPKVVELIEREYWDAVDFNYHSLWSDFENRFLSFQNSLTIEREILICEFTLFPDKFAFVDRPTLVTTMSDQEKDEKKQIALAYSRLIDSGRWDSMLKSRWDRNYYTLADAFQKSLTRLHKFREYCSRTGSANDVSLHEFNDLNDELKDCLGSMRTNPLPAPMGRVALSHTQAAMVLRYTGTLIQDPQTYPSSEANSMALNMCKLDSPSSGLQLYRAWKKVDYGSLFHKKLLERFVENPAKGKSIKKHLNDLREVMKHLGDGETKDRVFSDFQNLQNEYESLKY